MNLAPVSSKTGTFKIFMERFEMPEVKEVIEHRGARLLVMGVGKVGATAVAKMTGHIYDVECCIVEEVTDDVERCIREVDALFVVHAGDEAEAGLVAWWLVNITVNVGVLLVVVVTDHQPPEHPDSIKHTPWPANVARISVNCDCFATLDHDGSGNMTEPELRDLLLRLAVQQITDLTPQKSFIGVDFYDIKAILSTGGHVWLGIGYGTGPVGGAAEATQNALRALHKQGAPIASAQSILGNIYASKSVTMDDFDQVNRVVHDHVFDKANVIIGITPDDSFGPNYRVAVYVVEGEPT